ncbi:MAG: hypothetical protein JKP95_01350 [Oceanicaulis sp.]|nr:hypothetical protein [Oceanicaulis sp.]
MCQHMLDGLDLSWTKDCRHIFLIRDPAEVAASYHATMKRACAEDLGAIRQARLYDEICDLTGQAWPVIEGADVLENPAGMLRAVCDAVGIAYTDAMLSWRRVGELPTVPGTLLVCAR